MRRAGGERPFQDLQTTNYLHGAFFRGRLDANILCSCMEVYCSLLESDPRLDTDDEKGLH